MRKQELIQLHRLSLAVRTYLEARDEITADDCSRYDALDIDPMAINQPKDAHREAVTTLFAELTEATRRSAVADSSSDRSTSRRQSGRTTNP